MTAHEPRMLGYYAVSHWFQAAVVFVLLGVLALTILHALNEIEAKAERQSVELTVRNMRTGMQFAMADALVRKREHEIDAWIGSNPVRWLEIPPAGYRGGCSPEERQKLDVGAWCFDRVGRELVYNPRHLGSLHSQVDGKPCQQLVWRVTDGLESKHAEGFFGARIVQGSTCGWAIEGEKVGK